MRRSLFRSVSRVGRLRRAARDHLGSLMTRGWAKLPGGTVTTVDPGTLSAVLGIYRSSFTATASNQFGRYAAIFNHVFYIAKREGKVVGYCVNYIRPSLSRYGVRKTAVVYSFAVDSRHRRQGVGTQLLRTSIGEMRLNNIDEIRLYVDTRNTPAIALYSMFGFVVLREIANLCGRGEWCYEMMLAL